MSMIAPATELGGSAMTMVRTGVALVLIVAAVGKLRAPERFRSTVANYALLPRFLIAPVAGVLPAAELAAGVLLVTGVQRTLASGGAGLLLIGFAAAMAINLVRGRHDLACGCGFDRGETKIGWELVLRNLALAALLVLAAPVGPPSQPLLTFSSILAVALLLVLARASQATRRHARR